MFDDVLISMRTSGGTTKWVSYHYRFASKIGNKPIHFCTSDG